MEKLMDGLCVTQNGGLELRGVPQPLEAVPGHLLIRVVASGINGGDKAFLSRAMVPGVLPMSRYGVWGVSLAGEVMAIGAGVPERYRGAVVAGYRSLVASEHTVGTWSEYALLPYLSCVILPVGVAVEDYAGSRSTSSPLMPFCSRCGKKGIGESSLRLGRRPRGSRCLDWLWRMGFL